MKPKRIDFNETSFVANGVTYNIEYILTKERYVEKEKIEPVIRFGVTLDEIQKQFSDTVAMSEDVRVAPIKFIHTVTENAMNNLDIKSRYLEGKNVENILDYCCLFCNTEDEDIKKAPTARQIKKKKSDWEKEGIAMLDFFFLAWTGLGNLAQDFLELIKENQEQANHLVTDMNSLLKMENDLKGSSPSIPET